MNNVEHRGQEILLFETFSPTDQIAAWNVLSTSYFTQVPVTRRTEEGFQSQHLKYDPGRNEVYLHDSASDVITPLAYPQQEPLPHQIPWENIYIDEAELAHLHASESKRTVLYPKQRVPSPVPHIHAATISPLPSSPHSVEGPADEPQSHPTAEKIKYLWSHQSLLTPVQQALFDQIVIKLDNEPASIEVIDKEVVVTHPSGQFILVPFFTVPDGSPANAITMFDLSIGFHSLEAIHRLQYQLRHKRQTGYVTLDFDTDLAGTRQGTGVRDKEVKKIREQERIQEAAITMMRHFRVASRKEYKMDVNEVTGIGTVITFRHQAGNPNKRLPVDKHPNVTAAWDTLRRSSLIYNINVTHRPSTILIEDGIKLDVVDLPAHNQHTKTTPEQKAYREKWHALLVELEKTATHFDRTAHLPALKTALQARQVKLYFFVTQIVTSPQTNATRRSSIWQLGAIQGYSLGMAIVPQI